MTGPLRLSCLLLGSLALSAFTTAALNAHQSERSVSGPAGNTVRWPDIALTACPVISPPQNQEARVWKHGQAEADAFSSAMAQLEARNYSQAARQFSDFVSMYPDSDYVASALFGEMAAVDYEKNIAGQMRVSEKLVDLPSAPAAARAGTFVSLVALLSPYVRAGDPQEARKLSDLQKWTECGRAALAAESQTAAGSTDAALETTRYGESIFDRTDGYVALLHQDYDLAQSKLQAANSLNSQDPFTNLCLYEAYSLSSKPDFNAGVFYLARLSNLAPQTTQGDALLKRIYVMLHGSADGLADLQKAAMTNTVPPPGLNVLRAPKSKHRYGSSLVAGAILGLFAYSMVRYPWVAEGIANSASGETAPPSKVMIFGGPDHKTYLGCLSCSQEEQDSVFNRSGHYGQSSGPLYQDSIWNSLGQFGSRFSPYSACNPNATDPPVIVDKSGNAYGHLTVNMNSPDIGAGARLYEWLTTAVCRM